MYKITDEISLRSAIDKYIKFYAEERLQERFHCKTPLEVRSEALSAETPIQYPIAENKRIEAYKAKWCASSSLARQEREFARYDLDLSTKTMANWIINCADRYLKPLYQLMKEELLESRYIHCDESRIRYSENRIRKGRPRTGCGYISRMNSVVPRRWYSSIMKGPCGISSCKLFRGQVSWVSDL